MQTANYGLSTMFEEAQNQLARQFKSSATLRDHAKTIIGVSSVVVSFFATFKIFDNALTKPGVLIVSLFLLIGLAYGILMILAIRAASPVALEAPINPDLDDYIKAYADKDERTILSNQVNLYLRVIQHNNSVIQEQSRLSNVVDYLLGMVVILIIFSAVLSIAL